MKLIDISPPIDPKLAVWPGDTPASREVLLDIAKGDNITLSTLRATVHLGAHADAPNHYGLGRAIQEQPLEHYCGPCQVVSVAVPRGARIIPQMLRTEIRERRVLLRTGTFPDPTQWNPDFAALSPELVDFLHAEGVITVGIDTPSVDLSDDRELLAHSRFLAHEMAILEGLVLTDVADADYELFAFPLRLVGFDASPVRAVLRPL